jgi:hypothetical protein
LLYLQQPPFYYFTTRLCTAVLVAFFSPAALRLGMRQQNPHPVRQKHQERVFIQ